MEGAASVSSQQARYRAPQYSLQLEQLPKTKQRQTKCLAFAWETHLEKFAPLSWGWRDSTVCRIFSLHAADLSSIPGIPYSPCSLPGVDSESRIVQ